MGQLVSWVLRSQTHMQMSQFRKWGFNRQKDDQLNNWASIFRVGFGKHLFFLSRFGKKYIFTEFYAPVHPRLIHDIHNIKVV